jgi:hypothetical protein
MSSRALLDPFRVYLALCPRELGAGSAAAGLEERMTAENLVTLTTPTPGPAPSSPW